MKKSITLDTSAWIAYFEGRNRKLKTIVERSNLHVSSIALAEIAEVIERKKFQNLPVLQFIMENSLVVNIDMDIAIKAAKTKITQRKKSGKFSLTDGIHFATARSVNSVLVTMDNDFRGLANVRII